MKRVVVSLIALSLVGCETTGYREYAMAMTRIAEAQAQIAREQSLAMIALARDPNAGETTRTVAVLMLALGVQSGKMNATLAPPQNEGLEWAKVLLPTVATLGLGYWGYQLGKTQSNNQAQTTQASYAAFAAFKPAPIDFSTLPITTVTNTTTNTTTNTRTDTDVSNRDGNVLVGTGGIDNNRPIAIVPPVTIVPPVVPIVPVVTGP